MCLFNVRATLSVLLLFFALHCQAGIVIGGTRLIFHGDKKEASLSVSNPDKVPYLIQSWLETQQGSSAKSEFLVTPPLFRLDGGQKNLLRVEAIGSLPQDKETLFWFNIKAIPSSQKNENALKIAVKNRIKMIYRPASLNSQDPEALAAKLSWQRNGGTLTVNNPTPFYMNFMYIRMSGELIPSATYVAPHASASFTLPGKMRGNDIRWALITDYGGSGKEHQTSL